MMTTTYRVLLNGAKADREARQVAAEIERLFKIPFEKALALLAKPRIAVKGGVDYQHFLDQGGLRKENVWRGYKVARAGAFYKSSYGDLPFDAFAMIPGSGDLVLTGFSLMLWKDMGGKMASVDNLKASLAKDCGDWASAQRVGQTLMVEVQGVTCIITDDGSGQVLAGVTPSRMHGR